jgi:hypothetical protein
MTSQRKFRIPNRGPRRRRASGVRLSRQISGLDIDKRGFAVPPRVEGGKPRWQWLMRTEQPNGERRCEYIYAASFIEAEIVAERVAEEWRTGEAVEVAKAVKGWTVTEAFEQMMESKDAVDGGMCGGNRTSLRRVFEKEIEPLVGHIYLADLTDPQVASVKKKIAARQLPDGSWVARMDRTRQRVCRLFGATLRFAQRRGQLTVIPGEDLLKVKVARVSDGGDMREHAALDDDQVAALLTEIDRIATPAVAMACRVAATLGLRDQEISHLQLNALFLDTDVPYIWVRRHACHCGECTKNKNSIWTPKTKRERKVPIPPELQLCAYLAVREQHLVGRDSQHVFPVWTRTKRKRAGEMVGRSTYNDAVQQAVRNLRIEIDRSRQLLNFHSLRSVAHTALDIRSHGNVTAVSVALGHMLPGMADRYNRLRERLPELYAALFPDAVAELKVMRGSGKQKIA